jgi:hypothetical protein
MKPPSSGTRVLVLGAWGMPSYLLQNSQLIIEYARENNKVMKLAISS